MKKYKLNLYYNNQFIKRIKVTDEFKFIEETYILRIIGKKHLFGSNWVKIAFRFDKLKINYEDKHEAHIELKTWEGVGIK